ncbi:MAG: nicotinate-nucleotide adenylyltransferase [Pseudobdellovibrionaceae bacterium]
MRIGLFGGSFNPPHAGHLHASKVARTYLGLDAVWWLVSPGNPLKDNKATPSLPERIELCEEMVEDPHIIISGIEADLGTRCTYDTVKALKKLYPSTEFIWLAGTDIVYEFRRWNEWQKLIREISFAFIGRPTRFGVVKNNVFRQMKPLKNRNLQCGDLPSLRKGRIYWLFSDPFNPLSSTLLRCKASQVEIPTEKK